jgi:hypothetical protein
VCTIPTIHAFGSFRLDADAEILFHGSEPLPVGKRAAVLLRVLVERAGAPVSKDILIAAAWSGLADEESTLTVQIAELRRVAARLQMSAQPGNVIIDVATRQLIGEPLDYNDAGIIFSAAGVRPSQGQRRGWWSPESRRWGSPANAGRRNG